MSTSCLDTFPGACHRRCTSLHHTPVSGDWLCCTWVGGPEFGLVTILHYVFRLQVGLGMFPARGNLSFWRLIHHREAKTPSLNLCTNSGKGPGFLEGTDFLPPRILSNMLSSAPSYSFFYLMNIYQVSKCTQVYGVGR